MSDVKALYAALAAAKPGDVIELADGEYVSGDRLECAADGTKDAPITLRGTRKAVLRAERGPSGGNYGLHVTGDWWRLEGFRVTASKKGIVADGAHNLVIDGVEVDHIGQEAIHLRSGSWDAQVVNCDVHDTGLKSPSYGEGIYVGSAVSNWKATDGTGVPYGENNGASPDRSDRARIEGNHVWNTAAEGVDVKEGTTGGVIRNNRFDNCGWSGSNSADSWVDVKGSGYLVEGNTGAGTLLDAFQTHVIGGSTADSGTGNTFRGNTVEGGVPGYVVGVYPAPKVNGNIVADDNRGVGVAGVSNVKVTATGDTPPPIDPPPPPPAPDLRAVLLSIRKQIDEALR